MRVLELLSSAYARSAGNTWLRQLLELSTGVMTGAQGTELPLQSGAGLYGGRALNRVLMVKSHAMVDRVAVEPTIARYRLLQMSKGQDEAEAYANALGLPRPEKFRVLLLDGRILSIHSSIAVQ